MGHTRHIISGPKGLDDQLQEISQGEEGQKIFFSSVITRVLDPLVLENALTEQI